MKKTHALLSLVICLLVVGFISAGAQWAPPSGPAPTGNVPPPLNTGTTGQIKKSGLGLDSTNTLTSLVPGYLFTLKGDGISIEDNSTSSVVDTALKIKKGVVSIDSDLSGSNTSWSPSSSYSIDTDGSVRSHGLQSTRGVVINNPAAVIGTSTPGGPPSSSTPAIPGIKIDNKSTQPGIQILNTSTTGATAVRAIDIKKGSVVIDSDIPNQSNASWVRNALYALDTDGPISTNGVYASNNIATTNSLFSYVLKSTNPADPVARPVCAEKATGKLVICPCGANDVGDVETEISVNKTILEPQDFDPIAITWTVESPKDDPINCSGVTNHSGGQNYGSAWNVPSAVYAQNTYGPTNIAVPPGLYTSGGAQLNHIISCNQSSTSSCPYQSNDSGSVQTSYQKPVITGFKDGVTVTLNLTDADLYPVLGSFTKARWQGKFSSPTGWADLPLPMTFTNKTCTTNDTCNNVTQFRLYLKKGSIEKYSNILTIE